MKKFRFGLGALGALTALVASMALMGSGTALGDTNGCPANGTGNPQADNQVAASFSVIGNTATYTLDTTDEGSVDGVPGLIEYCVYAGTAPDSSAVNVPLLGANGDQWEDPTGANFSFQRPDGDPSNIPFDGTTDITMGTATWSSGVPTQTILLHINDPEVCDDLYGGNPLTCFVLPGNVTRNEAAALTVTKGAEATIDRKYTWDITKVGCKHGTDCVKKVDQVGGSVTFDYTIKVSHDGGEDSNWAVSGTITAHNPNDDDVTGVDLTDAVDNGGDGCTVTNGTDVTVPGGGSAARDYSCTYGSAPDPAAGTNTATATWPEQILLPSGDHLAGGFATGTADFDFDTATVNPTDECVGVVDDNATPANTLDDVTLGTVCVGDDNPKSFPFSRTYTVPQFDCVSYTNTAKSTTDDTKTTDTASETVTVCGPARTGALTMGFWQNKNGQGIITNNCNVPSANALRTFLRSYLPFQDLSATATCSQIATYVYNVIKAANSSGAAMNAMLKAQMLATALDVYFSDPALGGNKINAPAPLGGVAIDLTMICKMIDSSGGSAICSGTYYDTSSVFNNATCPTTTVSYLLSWAASQSNIGGTTWYGQVKATQEKAKNTFDAINNQVVFKC